MSTSLKVPELLHIAGLENRIAQLEADLAEAKKEALEAKQDQARYQWIRQCSVGTPQAYVVLTTEFEEMDEAIDEAIKESSDE